MLFILTVALTTATAIMAMSHKAVARDLDVPSLDVPGCPATGSTSYDNTVPSTDSTTFPTTNVSLCYDESFIHITFTALQEKSFYCKDESATISGRGDTDLK